MFKVPNKYRVRNLPRIKSDDSFGNNGCFFIPHYRIVNYVLTIIAADKEGWEHVSVSVSDVHKKPSRCPTWEEMCWVKKQFWSEEDCVIQYHPAKSEYVNCHPFVLHLWRPTEQTIPIPSKEMI